MFLLDLRYRSAMLERASFPRRLAALFMDWMVATFTAALFFTAGSSELTPSLARLAIFFLEVGVLTSLTGASIGQRIMGIRVVTWPEQLYARPKSAFLRTFLILLILPPIIIDREGRGLHDRIARTEIIRAR